MTGIVGVVYLPQESRTSTEKIKEIYESISKQIGTMIRGNTKVTVRFPLTLYMSYDNILFYCI